MGRDGDTGGGFGQSGVARAIGRTPRGRHFPVRRNRIAGSASGRFEAREEDEVVGHDRGPDVGLEVM